MERDYPADWDVNGVMERASSADGVSFYRQPGGCLEIRDESDGQDDIVHICEDGIPRFLAELQAFAQHTTAALAARDRQDGAP